MIRARNPNRRSALQLAGLEGNRRGSWRDRYRLSRARSLLRSLPSRGRSLRTRSVVETCCQISCRLCAACVLRPFTSRGIDDKSNSLHKLPFEFYVFIPLSSVSFAIPFICALLWLLFTPFFIPRHSPFSYPFIYLLPFIPLYSPWLKEDHVTIALLGETFPRSATI